MECDQVDRNASAMLTAHQGHQMAGGEEVISRASWYAALGRREIPCIKVGRRILIPRYAFMAWLAGGDASEGST